MGIRLANVRTSVICSHLHLHLHALAFALTVALPSAWTRYGALARETYKRVLERVPLDQPKQLCLFPPHHVRAPTI
jgi:hypothetical protein